MARPQIRPTIFIALQNGFAALLFAALLGAEIVRRLLHAYPQTDMLWQLSTFANLTVMPVLRYAEKFLPNPGWLMAALLAGIIVPLLAWWARYWFATALAGHVTLAALIVMTHTQHSGAARSRFQPSTLTACLPRQDRVSRGSPWLHSPSSCW